MAVKCLNLSVSRFGHCNSVFKRFVSWSRFDVWQNMLTHVSAKADLENVCINSTVVRAHACARWHCQQ